MIRLRNLLVSLIGIGILFGVVNANADGIHYYLAAKGIGYKQVDATTTVWALDEHGMGPYEFVCFAESDGPDPISSMQLQLPSLAWKTVSQESNWRFSLQEWFPSKATLNEYGSGTYVCRFQTGSGTYSPTLSISGDLYPNTPVVANWTAAQNINHSANFKLSWNAFTSPGTYDAIQVTIEDETGNTVFITPKPGLPGAIKATATYVVIPANTLAPGIRYRGRIVFCKTISRNYTGLPGATGIGGYFRMTEFFLKTANPVGRLQLSQPVFFANETNGVAEITVLRSGGSAGNVSIQYATYNYGPNNGNAIEGVDFTRTSGELEFSAGETSKTFDVPITANPALEGSKNFGINIYFPDGGATLGSPTYAKVTIIDNEALAQPQLGACLVAKGVNMQQTNAGPTVAGKSPAYQFYSMVDPGPYGILTNASGAIKVTSGTYTYSATFNFKTDERSFEYEQSFASKADMDKNYPNGKYKLYPGILGEGSKTLFLPISGDTYPSSPHISNWAAAQGIDANAPFTLTWDAFVSGAENDAIQLTIEEENGALVYETPGPWTEGALNGTATSVTLNANTLEPGKDYRGSLLFANLSGAVNTTGYPGAVGMACYFRKTAFTLSTRTAQFSTSNYDVDENGAQATATVIRRGSPEGQLTVKFWTDLTGSASADDDFLHTSGTLIFAPGQTSTTFPVWILDDSDLERPESIGLVLADADGNPLDCGTITIWDDEASATANVDQFVLAKGVRLRQTNAGPCIAPTGEARYLFYAFVEPAFAGAIEGVRLRYPNGKTGTLCEEGGRYTLEAACTTKAVLDSIFPNGTFTYYIDTLGLGMSTNSVSLTGDLYPVTPHVSNWTEAQDIDASADFVLAWDPFTNGAEEDYVCVQIFDAEARNVFSTPALGQDGALTAEDSSVLIPANTLPAGQKFSATLLFVNQSALNTTGDPATGICGYFRETAFCIETSPEEPPGGRLQFSAPEYSVTETGTVATLTVTRSRGDVGQVWADFTTLPGTAIADVDYLPTAARLFLATGQLSTNITVPILDDAVVDSTKTVLLSLRNPGGDVASGGAILGPQSNAVLRITDSELTASGVLQFKSTTYSVSETSQYAVVYVSRTGSTSRSVAVQYATSPGTADPDLEYSNVTGTLTFGVGVTSRNFKVPIQNDSAYEPNKTVLLCLSSPSDGAALGSRTNAVLTIINEDAPGILAFSTNSFRVSETGAVATITVVRTKGLAEGITVDYTTSNRTAIAGVDYVPSFGTLSFAAGQRTASFTVTISDDSIYQPDKIIDLILSNPTGGASIGTIATSRLTIVDNEPENALGNYRMSGSIYFWNSKIFPTAWSATTGTNNWVSITNQAGAAFSGTARLTLANGAFLNIYELKGTVNSAGVWSGSYKYTGKWGLRGAGSCKGKVTPTRFSLTLNGKDQTVDTGYHTGTASGAKF